MLAEFQDETSASVASATADRDGVKAEYMARSAVNLARLVIASEPTVRAAISPLYMLLKSKPPQLPVWEFSDRLLAAFNDQDSVKDFGSSLGLDMSLGKNLGLAGGKFQLSIVDEDAKIDVNLGAANEIAHIRLAKEIMGLHLADRVRPDVPVDGTRTVSSTTACRPARRSSTGQTSTSKASTATRRRTPRRAAESRTRATRSCRSRTAARTPRTTPSRSSTSSTA